MSVHEMNSHQEPCPVMPEAMQRQERIHLKGIVAKEHGTFPYPVHAIVPYVATLTAALQENGTFVYDDGEVGYPDLNSFELLWHLKQQGIRLKTHGCTIDGLGPMMAKDPNFALRFIYCRWGSCLSQRVEELVRHVPEPYEAVIGRLTVKEMALLHEIKALEEIIHKKGSIRALEARRNELKALADI